MKDFIIILFGLEELHIGEKSHGGIRQCGKHIITPGIQFKIVCTTGIKELDTNLIGVVMCGRTEIDDNKTIETIRLF